MLSYLFWGGAFHPETLTPRTLRFVLWVAAFVAGNLVFPLLAHSLPQGGMVFLPIYFFTLIAAYRFGLWAGLATAILSPLLNNLLTGMPPLAFLDIIVVKSAALAVMASLVAGASRQVSLGSLVLVIASYQIVGGAYEALRAGSVNAALGDWVLGWPGLLIQLVLGGLILGFGAAVRVKPLEHIQDRIRAIELKEPFDLIVAVARGGVIPAMLLQARLGIELEWMWLHFRADDQTPVRPEPTLVRPLAFDPVGRAILVVDDRSSTGGTLRAARSLLSGARLVRTLAVNGTADYSLFEDECFYFPWRMDIPPGTESERE